MLCEDWAVVFLSIKHHLSFISAERYLKFLLLEIACFGELDSVVFSSFKNRLSFIFVKAAFATCLQFCVLEKLRPSASQFLLKMFLGFV